MKEIISYIHHIWATWLKIGGSEASLQKLCKSDILQLELRCPRFCTTDAADIKKHIEGASLFPNFDADERMAMFANASSVPYIIPTLRTLFRDMYVLMDCAMAIKHIVPSGVPIRKALWSSFTPNNELFPALTDDIESVFHESMSVLWAYALKNFKKLPFHRGWRSQAVAKPILDEPDRSALAGLGFLACKLGFHTPEISQLTANSLATSAEDETFSIHDTKTRGVPDFMCQEIWTNNSRHSTSRLTLRCGRPREQTYQRDRILLTKRYLQSELPLETIQAPELSSLFILRCQYLAFFYQGKGLISYHSSSTSGRTSEHTQTIIKETESFPLISTSQINTTQNDSVSSYTSGIISDEYETEPSDKVSIRFMEWKCGELTKRWEVDAADVIDVQEKARQLLREGMKLFSEALYPIEAHDCFSSALSSRKRIIVCFPQDDIDISSNVHQAVKLL